MSPHPEIIEDKEITMAEVSSEVEKIKKRDKELNYRTQKTEEYLSLFVKISKKDAEEAEKKITELNIPRLKEVHIKKIIDLMPSGPDDVKSILSGFSITINNENLKKLSSIIAEYKK